MKKLVLISVILFLFFPKIISGGVLNCVTSTNIVNVIAAGDSGLIMRSSNSGITWNEYRITSDNYKSIFYNGNKIFIGNDNGTLYYLNPDNTLTVQFTFIASFSINSIYFLNADAGYLCGSGGNIYKTLNGGANWQLINSGIGVTDLNSVYFISAEIGYTAGNGGKIFFTSNGGSSWSEENSGTGKDLLDIFFYNGKTYSSGKDGVLTVKETTWSLINTKIKTDIRAIAKSGDNVIHVCGGGGFIRNNSADPAFEKFEKNPAFGDLSDIHFYEDRGWAVNMSNKAILRTTDNGNSWNFQQNVTNTFIWESKITGMDYTYTNTLCINPQNKNSVYAMYNDEIYATYDKGYSFRQVSRLNIFDTCKSVSFLINPSDTNLWLTASYKSTVGYVITRSTDHGNTWSIVLDNIEFPTYSTPLEISESSPNIVYYVNQNGRFYKSTNFGQSFTKISNYPFRSPYDLLIKKDNPNEILVADATYPLLDSSKLIKSTDGGLTWQVKYVVNYEEISSLTVNPFNNSEVYFLASKFYKSQNFGNSWELIYTPVEPLWVLDFCSEDPNTLLTSRYYSPNCISVNGGLSYQFFNNPYTFINLNGIVFPEKNYAIAKFNTGIYRLRLLNNAPVSIFGSNEYMPVKYFLSQNYPNPFNPVTRIRYEIPSTGDRSVYVSLKVYDILGNEIAVLVNENKQAGYYEVEFNGESAAGGLASGIYFYRLEAGSFKETKRMLLIK